MKTLRITRVALLATFLLASPRFAQSKHSHIIVILADDNEHAPKPNESKPLKNSYFERIYASRELRAIQMNWA